MRLPIENVIVPAERIRDVDMAWAEAMAVTLQDGAELPPILTRPLGELDGFPLVELVTGGHRLVAHGLAGLADIDCTIKPMTDAEAAMAEADENLMRRDLTPHERALSVQARLSAYAIRFPDRVKVGEDGALQPKRGRPAKSEKFAELATSMGFSDETAAAVGLSEKSVRNALVIARGLSPAVHKALRSTAVARNDALLRQLAGVGDPDEQLAVTQQLLGGVKSFSDACALAAGNAPAAVVQSPVDETLNALRKLWKAAPPSHREALLHWLEGQKLPAGWSVVNANG